MGVPVEPWLQRLREGRTPPVRWLLVLLAAFVVVGVLLTTAEALHLGWVAEAWEREGRVGVIVLVPPALVVAGLAVALTTWWVGRRDRRALDRVRASASASSVVLVIPVSTPPVTERNAVPGPPPVLWTVDAVGLHAWSTRSDRPVRDLPWNRIRSIDVATRTVRGRDEDFGIWIATDRGLLVVAPRSALGRPFAGGAAKRDVLVAELRSARTRAGRDVDRSPTS